MKKLSLIFVMFTLVGFLANAQETYEENGGYNPNSIRPIHVSQQMYKKTLWRMIDLREPQNKGFFAVNREISRILIDGARSGKITPYVNDSLTKTMTIEEFIKKVTIPGAETSGEDEFGGGSTEDEWGSSSDFGSEEDAPAMEISNEYLPNGLYQLELKEDMIFDRKRSRMYYDIQAVSLYVPADNPDNIKGIQELMASFKYVDMVKLFQMDKRSYWANEQNAAENKNMADAFDLRLFSSYIVKIENPDNLFLEDIYGDPRGGILGSQKASYDLMEYEHNLWEF